MNEDNGYLDCQWAAPGKSRMGIFFHLPKYKLIRVVISETHFTERAALKIITRCLVAQEIRKIQDFLQYLEPFLCAKKNVVDVLSNFLGLDRWKIH